MSALTMATTGTQALLRASLGGAAVLGPAWPRRLRRIRHGVAAGICCLAVASAPAFAETWRFDSSVGIQGTLTNNVDLQPSGSRQGDFITQITPGFGVSGTGAHATITGTVSLPILLYARTGSDNNRVLPQVNLVGNAELVDRFFFVDGVINISQQFASPFGAQPNNLGNATDNRFTSQLYRVSPYIKGVASGNLRYELRDDNIWSNPTGNSASVNGTPVSTNSAYTNQVTGNIRRDPTPFGWEVEYNRADVRFNAQDPQLTELGRLRLLHQSDPQLELGASFGYERNDFPLTDYRGAIYGAGFKWRPSAVASADGFWEHRFFGGSYGLTLDYRTPLSVWGFRASRGITSYPQQLATLPAGGNVPALLNELFSSRIVDPTERQRAVDQLIRDRGLPATLSGPVILSTQQITLQDSASATFGLLGARNSAFATVFYLRSEPIAGSGTPIPPDLAGQNNNTQVGASISWSNKLTSLVSLVASANWARARGNVEQARSDGSLGVTSTNQGSIRVFLSAPISPQTSVYGGARYQVQTSNTGDNDYNEAAVFVGLSYLFR